MRHPPGIGRIGNAAGVSVRTADGLASGTGRGIALPPEPADSVVLGAGGAVRGAIAALLVRTPPPMGRGGGTPSPLSSSARSTS